MNMKANVLIALLVTVMALSVSATPTAYNGIVSIDSARAKAGDHFSVKVRLLNNNINIAGLTVPLKYGPNLTLDSVVLDSAFIDHNYSAYSVVDNGAKTVRVSYILTNYVSPLPTLKVTNGVICELRFTMTSTQATAVDSINSSYKPSATTTVWTRIEIADSSGMTSYLPIFRRGEIRSLVPMDVDDNTDNLPASFSLSQNYPNPFNPSTMIEYSLPKGSFVNLEVFNVLGQKVVELENRHRDAGVHQVIFNASDYPSGVYFYRLSHNGGSETKKMILLK